MKQSSLSGNLLIFMQDDWNVEKNVKPCANAPEWGRTCSMEKSFHLPCTQASGSGKVKVLCGMHVFLCAVGQDIT